jgi:hypothetical protein
MQANPSHTRKLRAGVLLAALALFAPAAAAQGSSVHTADLAGALVDAHIPPPIYIGPYGEPKIRCPPEPGPNSTLVDALLYAECVVVNANVEGAWFVIWYFPPGAYQVLCGVGVFCPCYPSPGCSVALDDGVLVAVSGDGVPHAVSFATGATSFATREPALGGGLLDIPGPVIGGPPVTVASPGSGQTGSCSRPAGDVAVQVGTGNNSWSCDTCTGHVVVQAGTGDQDVDCPNGCVGMVVVQVGLGNAGACYLKSVAYALGLVSGVGGSPVSIETDSFLLDRLQSEEPGIGLAHVL